jgi:hypothetical protein
VIPPDPWADVGQHPTLGREEFGNRWLLLTGDARWWTAWLPLRRPLERECMGMVFILVTRT